MLSCQKGISYAIKLTISKGIFTMAVDSIVLEIIRNRLDIICEEMQVVLRRSCRSNIIKEAADALNAIFNPKGEFISQSISIPCHLGMIIPIVRQILEKFFHRVNLFLLIPGPSPVGYQIPRHQRRE